MPADTENNAPMTYGLPGQITRSSGDLLIEPKLVADPAPESYGHAVSMTSDGKVTRVSASAATVIYGFMVGAFPRMSLVPVAGKTDNVARRGYMAVSVGAGEPSPEAPVYVRIQNPAEGKPIGGAEAVPDGTNTVLVQNAKFKSEMDANGSAEIYFLLA